MSDLKPCPFCGSSGEQWKHHISGEGDICPVFHVGCRNNACAIMPAANIRGEWGYPQKDDISDEQAQSNAIKFWNSRADSAELAILREERDALRGTISAGDAAIKLLTARHERVAAALDRIDNLEKTK